MGARQNLGLLRDVVVNKVISIRVDLCFSTTPFSKRRAREWKAYVKVVIIIDSAIEAG